MLPWQPVQGTTKAQCTLYLWNYTDKIVVSDIDGTITRYGHVYTFEVHPLSPSHQPSSLFLPLPPPLFPSLLTRPPPLSPSLLTHPPPVLPPSSLPPSFSISPSHFSSLSSLLPHTSSIIALFFHSPSSLIFFSTHPLFSQRELVSTVNITLIFDSQLL